MCAFAAMVPKRTYVTVAPLATVHVLAWIVKVTSKNLVAIKDNRVATAKRAKMPRRSKRRQTGKTAHAHVPDALSLTAANIADHVRHGHEQTRISRGIAKPATSNGNVPVE